MKKKIYKKVTDKVNPLIEKLKKIQDGEYPIEEFSSAYWTRNGLQIICDKIFEETYKLTNATSTKKRKQRT
jgi:hypothetical protein